MLERRPADADRLGRDQHALRVHAVQDVLEAAPFLADQIVGRDLEVGEEELVQSTHLRPIFSISHRDALAVEVGIEERLRPSVGLVASSSGVVRASREDAVGDLRGRDPDLLAVDDVVDRLSSHRLQS